MFETSITAGFEFKFEFDRFQPVTGPTGPVNRNRWPAVRSRRSDKKTLAGSSLPPRVSELMQVSQNWSCSCYPAYELLQIISASFWIYDDASRIAVLFSTPIWLITRLQLLNTWISVQSLHFLHSLLSRDPVGTVMSMGLHCWNENCYSFWSRLVSSRLRTLHNALEPSHSWLLFTTMYFFSAAPLNFQSDNCSHLQEYACN